MIGSLLKGVADQGDFIPGFDPDPEKRGLLSQIFGLNKGSAGTPPIVAPGSVQPAINSGATSGQPLEEMLSSAPQIPGAPTFESSVGTLERLLAPGAWVQARDAQDVQRYKEATAAHEAQAAVAERRRLTAQGMAAGLSGRDLLAFISNPSGFFDPQVVNSGDSVFSGGQFSQAPETFTSVEDGAGRPMAFGNVSGQFGAPVGPEKPVELADGAQLFQGGEMVAENVKDFSPRPSTVINNNLPANRGESAFAKGLGENAANSMTAINEAGVKAQRMTSNLATMETLLDQIDYTGFGGDTLLTAQRIGGLLGVDVGDDVGAKEAAQRITYEMGLALKENLPGPMSDADREFLISIPPNINVSSEANDALLYIMRRRAEYESDMQRSLNQANPTTLQEFMAWENEFRTTYPPLFSAQDRIEMSRALAGQSE